MNTENTPEYFANFVRVGKDGRDTWTRIGAMFTHRTGGGFNLLLDMLPPPDPVTGAFKIVIRKNPALQGSRFPTSSVNSPRMQGAAVTPPASVNPCAGGGDCPACQGRGVKNHPTRGPIPCPHCGGS